MNFNGHTCPKCKSAVTRSQRRYKCRCGWSYKEPDETYATRMKRYFEKRDKKCAEVL